MEDKYLWVKYLMPQVYREARKLGSKHNKTLLINLPLTWETVCLVDALRLNFQKIIVVPLTSGKNSSLQLGVFPYLKQWGIRYFEKATVNNKIQALKEKPEVIIDCLFTVSQLGFENKLIDPSTLIIEDTRTGGLNLRNYLKTAPFPNKFVILDDDPIKKNYENKKGIGYSVVASLMALGLFLEGKKCIVVGFGPVGQGVAKYLKRMYAEVSVVEKKESSKRLADKLGFKVTGLESGVLGADIVVSATGVKNAITQKAIRKLKDGAILVNAGADFGEWDQKYLAAQTVRRITLTTLVEKIVLKNGKSLIELAGGNSLNLVSGISVSEMLDKTFSLAIIAIRQFLNDK